MRLERWPSSRPVVQVSSNAFLITVAEGIVREFIVSAGNHLQVGMASHTSRPPFSCVILPPGRKINSRKIKLRSLALRSYLTFTPLPSPSSPRLVILIKRPRRRVIIKSEAAIRHAAETKWRTPRNYLQYDSRERKGNGGMDRSREMVL